MATNIDAALKAGYSEDELIQELSKQNNFDYVGAIKSGYTKPEILGHLSTLTPTLPKEQPPQSLSQEPSTIDAMNTNLARMVGGAELENVEPTTGSDIVKSFVTDPRAVGASIGGGLGSLIPGGTVPGAMLGGAAGEASRQIAQAFTGDTNAPKNIPESMQKFGTAGLVSGSEQVIGNAVAGAANKVIAPFAKYITDEGKIALQTLDQYMPKNMFGNSLPGVTAAEMSENRWLQFMSNISDKSWFGGPIMSKYKDVIRKNAVNEMMDDVAQQMGPVIGSKGLGEAIVSTANGNWDLYKRQIAEPIYNTIAKGVDPVVTKIPKYEMVDGVKTAVGEIEKKSGGASFSLKDLKKSLQPKLDRIEELSGIASDTMGDNLVTSVSKLPDDVSYSTIKELRTRLMAYKDNMSIVSPKAPALGQAKDLIGKIDKITENGLKDFDVANQSNFYGMWRDANTTYSEGKSLYNNKFLRKLTALADPRGANEPSKVMETILQHGGQDNVEKVVNAVGPDIHQQMKRWYIEDVMKGSFDSKSETFSSRLFYDKLFGKQSLGDEFINKFFTKEEVKQLSDAATTLRVVQIKPAGGLGGMAIQMAQMGAVGGLMYGGTGAGLSPAASAMSAGIIVSPAILAKMLTSPMATKYLTNTKKFSPYLGQEVSNIVRLSQLVETLEKEVISEDQKAQKARQ
jgi:hypothetical protein